MPQPITALLWPAGAPLACGETDLDKPQIVFHRAPDAKACVLVCPGGGYQGLATHEGAAVAELLNAHGIAAAVLRSRLGAALFASGAAVGSLPRHAHAAPTAPASGASTRTRSR